MKTPRGLEFDGSKLQEQKNGPEHFKWADEALEMFEVSLRYGEGKAATCRRSPKKGRVKTPRGLEFEDSIKFALLFFKLQL